MRVSSAFCLAALLILPAQAANITAQGRQILRDGTPLQVRGVCYAPTPVGQTGDQPPYGDYFTAAYASLYTRDLALMRKMGVNTVRVYGWDPAANHTGFLDAAYNNGESPICVLLNRWVNPNTDWNNAAQLDLIISDWLRLATNAMNHPAVIGYIIGNELNWTASNRYNTAFWSALNRIAGAIRQRDPNHLISTALADQDLTSTLAYCDALMTNFNSWCIQAYRGASFGTLFREYAGVSAKPLLVTEFGMDAYDARSGTEYGGNAEVQATYLVSLWNEIRTRSTIVSGGCVFEWADEWWKSGMPSVHNPGGWASSAFPDGSADEEWWGINRVVPGNAGAPDSAQPRDAYYRLQDLWTTTLEASRASADTILISVKNPEGETAVLQRSSDLKQWTPVATNTIPFNEVRSLAYPAPQFFRTVLR